MEAFKAKHASLLSSIPLHLHEKLYQKLQGDIFDAGEFVELHKGEVEEPIGNKPDGSAKLEAEIQLERWPFTLHVKDGVNIPKDSNVFLVDHAWTTTPQNAKDDLLNNAALLRRMEKLLDLDEDDISEWIPLHPPLSSSTSSIPVEDDLVDDLMSQLEGQFTRQEAREALQRANGEILNAIMELTVPKNDEGLIADITASLGVDGQENNKRKRMTLSERVDRVLDILFLKHGLQYQLGNSSEIVFYVNDEVGSAIMNSNDPNVQMIAFVVDQTTLSPETIDSLPSLVPYSVFWPIKDLKSGDILTRKF